MSDALASVQAYESSEYDRNSDGEVDLHLDNEGQQTQAEGISAMALPKWYRNYVDGQRISNADNRAVAKAMLYSLETAVGFYSAWIVNR